MTRTQILDRVNAELASWAQDGDDGDEVSAEDLDDLIVSIDAAVDECRGFLEQQFGSDKETT